MMKYSILFQFTYATLRLNHEYELKPEAHAGGAFKREEGGGGRYRFIQNGRHNASNGFKASEGLSQTMTKNVLIKHYIYPNLSFIGRCPNLNLPARAVGFSTTLVLTTLSGHF